MFFNDAVTSSKFPSSLKMANIKAVSKKGKKSLKENYRPISILRLVSKILRELFASNEQLFLIIFYRNISVDLEKAIVHNTVYW